ncbi:hypothetical protein H5392_02130 [Tessaracoccus sp. MC1865]|uniref:protealysin inhibitor emfourin n=1 Tax=unclassified Tessaracoccus TaxID=2635419 RepID=UPI00160321FF|nr:MULTISPECIES: protealysin inhibitor emfourin [unclassified Tessaracoccus]MBB1482657.1 hypothetical protein [Tessaracoccus sp. MC1865]MBB1509849.1 hypothetical protein [Tessaracoccus sp. MC1756]QTO37892.1 hypothetical protein J7D54_01960 [Tessaracoccus sp. MC1865]
MTAADHPAVVALSAAIENAANLLRIPREGVALEGMEARDWPDSCLGLAEDDDACADVITPGYLIRLGDGFTYHADQQGNVRRARGDNPRPDTEIRLRYSVSGGIAGRSTSYETDSYQLTKAEDDELRRLITEADFFTIPNSLPDSPVADGITARLWIAVGRRSHEVVRGDGIDAEDTEAFHALVAWVDARTPPLFPEVSGNLV